jgi:hypothetical protein
MDAKPTILLYNKNYCCEIQRTENQMLSDRILYGRLKKGCFANNDDDDEAHNDDL